MAASGEIIYERPNLLDSTHDGVELINSNRFAFLMMLGMDVMLFVGLGGGYMVLRGGSLSWPPPGAPSLRPAVMVWSCVFIVLASVVFAVGLKNHKKGNARQARLALFAGSLLILGFLITNAFEWSYLITNGMDIMTVFGGIYYTLMGTFLIHVVIGSIFLFWIISRTMRTGNSGKSVNSVTHVAYFFYVLTLLWLSIYGLVYS